MKGYLKKMKDGQSMFTLNYFCKRFYVLDFSLGVIFAFQNEEDYSIFMNKNQAHKQIEVKEIRFRDILGIVLFVNENK